MARAKQPKQVHQMTIGEWEKAFPDEEACCAYLVAVTAGQSWRLLAPRCGNVKRETGSGHDGTDHWQSATLARTSNINGLPFLRYHGHDL